MTCGHKLAWYELIPVLSFLSLRGRCRVCQSRISIQYPLVELASGLIFAFLFIKFFYISNLDFAISYAFYAVMFSFLVVISTYDLKHKIIPDMLVYIFGALAFVGLFLFKNYVFFVHVPTLLEFLSGVLIALPFAFFWLVSGGRWMGFGDAKLALGLGWFLGLSAALSGLVIAFWSGAIIGITLVVFSKIKRVGGMGMKSEIPFAPFLIFGALSAFIFELNFFNKRSLTFFYPMDRLEFGGDFFD